MGLTGPADNQRKATLVATLAIVGAEEAKFTKKGKAEALRTIRHLILNVADEFGEVTVISGACHLGGVDVWAEQVAKKLGVKFRAYPPKQLSWAGGYRERNLQIARACDLIACIVVARYPDNYTGMKFSGCYHCPKDFESHVKSGGCWTAKQAVKMGKRSLTVVISNKE